MNRLALSWLAVIAVAASAQPDKGPSQDRAAAIFAGGCFWCVEEAFDEVDGVLSTVSGYTGGDVPSPTYERVSRGDTGHFEAVRIEFDPAIVSYETLLEVFWHNIDPVDGGGQFCDRGEQYRSAIFYVDDVQRELAERSKRELDESGALPGDIATEILPAAEFYPAEEYHQDFYRRNPLRYRFYKYTCGRPARLEELWSAG